MIMYSRQQMLDVHRSPANLVGTAWLLLALVATLPVFWFGFEGLVWRYQVVLPLVSLLLMLQVLRSVPPAAGPVGGRWLGVVGVAAALLLALLANLMRIDSFVVLAMVAWVAGMIVVSFGLRRGLAFWAPVASLLLIVPYPKFVVFPVRDVLEGLVSALGVAGLRLAGVPVRVEGQVIDFGVAQVRIAEVLPGVAVTPLVLLVCLVFVTAYRGPFWLRLMPLVLAVPVMVGLAGVRVLAVGLAIDGPGDGGAQRVLELSGGWVYVGASILILLAFVALAQRLAGVGGSILGRLDVDLVDLAAQSRRFLAIPTTPALIAASLMTVVVSAAYVIGPSRPAVAVERESFERFPPDIGEWQGTRSVIGAETEGVLNADDYALIDYFNRSERAPVNFWSAFYYTQDRDKGGIHSPEVCLPLDGWNIVSVQPVAVALEGTRAGSVTLNRAVISKGDVRSLVYYWFDGRGRRLASEWNAKFLLKADAFTMGRTDGALVRFVTPILPEEPEAEADARIQRLMVEIIDQLPRFVPE